MICVHRDSLGRFVLILSFNTNLGTYMGHLSFVIHFGRNNQHENTQKSMCYWITFLNFLNSDQGVPMNPKRIKVIPEWPTPPSIKKIWGFHDLTNFYKRFVPNFSILVAPLIELVRNYVPSWEDAQEGVFIPYPTPTYQTPLIYMFLFFLQVLREKAQKFKKLWIWGQILFKGEGMMQSYPLRALERRFQED